MDQIKIGKFISECRRALPLTQRELADKLLISDKTVSKWECGKGLPEVSLMMPLCEILHISVNELLSGEHLDEKKYHEKAEENMMNLIQEKQESKKKIMIASLVALVGVISALSLLPVSGLAELSTPVRIMLIAVAMADIILCIGISCYLDRDAGTFECRHCKARFVPNMKDYVMAPHTITTRYLKCPACGKSSYCKKRLTR